MANEITIDDIDRQFHLRRTDPQKFLQLTDMRVKQHPEDARAYFARHQAWSRIGDLNRSLADIDESLRLEDCYMAHEARGRILHGLGRHQDAIDAYNRSEALDPAEWKVGFGPLFRADSHARLGNVSAALADCDTLPEDHWTPGFYDAPAGTKSEVAVELRRRAAAVRGQR